MNIFVKPLTRPVLTGERMRAEEERESAQRLPSPLTVVVAVMKPTRIQTPEGGAREKRGGYLASIL